MIKLKLKKYKDGSGILCVGSKEAVSFEERGKKYELLNPSKISEEDLIKYCSQIKYTFSPSIPNLIKIMTSLEAVKSNIKSFKEPTDPEKKSKSKKNYFHLFNLVKYYNFDTEIYDYATFGSRKYVTSIYSGGRKETTPIDPAHHLAWIENMLKIHNCLMVDNYISFENLEDIETFLTIEEVENTKSETTETNTSKQLSLFDCFL